MKKDETFKVKLKVASSRSAHIFDPTSAITVINVLHS